MNAPLTQRIIVTQMPIAVTQLGRIPVLAMLVTVELAKYVKVSN